MLVNCTSYWYKQDQFAISLSFNELKAWNGPRTVEDGLGVKALHCPFFLFVFFCFCIEWCGLAIILNIFTPDNTIQFSCTIGCFVNINLTAGYCPFFNLICLIWLYAMTLLPSSCSGNLCIVYERTRASLSA